MKNNKGFSTRSGNGWGIGVSARATRQIVLRTVREANMKGKLSMAKTLRSRIAAVAVAAVGFGAIQGAPAFAAAAPTLTPFSVSNAESTTGARTTAVKATQIAGDGNYVSVGFNGTNYAYDGTFSATKAGFLTVSGGTFTSTGAANATVNAAGTTATLDAADATTNVNVLTPTAGTITVRFVVRTWSSGVATDTTEQTITITVGDATVNVYGSSKAYIGSDPSSTPTEDATAAALTYAKAAAKRAIISVTQYDKQATPVALSSGFKTVTFSLSGVGALGTSSAATGSYVSTSTPTSGARFDTYVYSDGRAGTATITVSVNGVAVSTKTVTFFGSVASYTPTVAKTTVASSGSATTGAVTVLAKDSAGIPVVGATVYATVGTSTLATVTSSATTDADGVASFSVTGVASKYGDVTITFMNAAALADATLTSTATVTISSVRAATVTITTDKATYAPGEKITFTLTAKDANGLGLPTASYAAGDLLKDATTNPSTTTSLTSSPLVGSSAVSIKGGVATGTAYAPLVAGPVTVTWTLAGTAGGSATTNLSADLVGTTVSAKFTVVADTTAIDAAKAAADAAKAEAAKATAAVAALSTTLTAVQTAMTALVASITSTMTLVQAQIAKIMAKLKIK